MTWIERISTKKSRRAQSTGHRGIISSVSTEMPFISTRGVRIVHNLIEATPECLKKVENA